MQITDPIADLLTRIRNASTAKHPSVEIPASNMKKAICQILVDEGYIKGMQGVWGTLAVCSPCCRKGWKEMGRRELPGSDASGQEFCSVRCHSQKSFSIL